MGAECLGDDENLPLWYRAVATQKDPMKQESAAIAWLTIRDNVQETYLCDAIRPSRRWMLAVRSPDGKGGNPLKPNEYVEPQSGLFLYMTATPESEADKISAEVSRWA